MKRTALIWSFKCMLHAPCQELTAGGKRRQEAARGGKPRSSSLDALHGAFMEELVKKLTELVPSFVGEG